jgi:hypothetical protein
MPKPITLEKVVNIAAPHPEYPSTHCRDAQFKRLFGLHPTQKWPDAGLGTRHVTTSDGHVMFLWVEPKSSGSRQGVPRLMARCPRCDRTVGAGKVQQHYRSHG